LHLTCTHTHTHGYVYIYIHDIHTRGVTQNIGEIDHPEKLITVTPSFHRLLRSGKIRVFCKYPEFLDNALCVYRLCIYVYIIREGLRINMISSFQHNSRNTFNIHRGENTMSNNFKLESSSF
jgi:hypothetical protein